jgi:putative membrane protein insertion efficiency factor
MIRKLIIGAIRLYQAGLSPLLPASCRFTPTCSEYAVVAVERFGPWRGSLLAAKRLLRCHPLGGKGFDPVPAEPGTPESRTDGR